MKYYKKPLVALTLLALCVQSNADVLQTSVGANHSTPKVINQTENSTTSESLEINPYGKLSDVNQVQSQTIGIDFDQNPFIYGSGYHDSESNLEYMGARYYSAEIGRFMAQDSYDLINLYNYANANPIMYVDPDGHFAVGDFLLSMIPGYGTYYAFANDRPWYEKALSIGMDVLVIAGISALSYKLLSPSVVEGEVVDIAGQRISQERQTGVDSMEADTEEELEQHQKVMRFRFLTQNHWGNKYLQYRYFGNVNNG